MNPRPSGYEPSGAVDVDALAILNTGAERNDSQRVMSYVTLCQVVGHQSGIRRLGLARKRGLAE